MPNQAKTKDIAETVRYKKPKILTVDLPVSLAQRLRDTGYNVMPGTFGCPYKVKKGDNYFPVIVKASVPNYSEQEIIVVDLTAPETAEGPQDEKHTSLGELDWYAKASSGVIDPRPRAMAWLKEDFDRILVSGGVFVVFAKPRLWQTTVLGSVEDHYGPQFQVREKIEADNWSFLSTLSQYHLKVEPEHGTEIKVKEGLSLLKSFLRRHLDGATFSATFHPLHPLTEDGNGLIFVPLATSKFGETVAAVLVPRKQGGGGFVLILPQLHDKEGAVLDLIQNLLPEVRPNLFPDHEGGRWVHGEEYEHPSILERKALQMDVRRKADEEISRLDDEIEAERDRLGFLHGILTKSGDALVADVKHALEFMGCRQVVDVDQADDAEASKQEDLQILGESPTLLLEIKGLGGMPTEGDTLQVTKYVLRRMRQWNRTDVHGISLVNHQRNLPPLARDHQHVFTEQQAKDAEQNGTGLMTTWDLFRLLRGKVRWGWSARAVSGLLKRTGRIPPYPAHYVPVGTVAKYWPDKGVISIGVHGQQPLRVGDRLGFLLPAGFFEEEVMSLQVDKNSVREATPGQRVGHKTTLDKADVSLGTTVFLVTSV
jgi:hypothetical protein